MGFSDHLLEVGADHWDAQKEHPFVVELAEGTLDEAAFLHWVRQDYHYLLDYARTFALLGAKAEDEETMAHLYGVAHRVVDDEMDLHREFAASYGVSPADLVATEKAPTCVAYTNYLLRVARECPLPVGAAVIYPCGQGYLDIADHMAELSDGDHRYTPFIEKYTSDGFRDAVAWIREFVDEMAEAYPDQRDAMEDAFRRSTKLEHTFWEMAYTGEEWPTTETA
ncbi:thiaminase II [Haloferax sp. MBLA0076]|uniref:Thiaminase II n=1 Tax=Haloferax litoreum TaxID=2666140 RepID=A0A6A8GHN1_9EURY|nr:MULTISPECIES: thiaminase II [Haloferax]KAB1193808.1 thiaminase II [Haloferax sp. CBA1148]MRX22349.1 thiaminase II [Haloferax litoreum]